MDSHLPGLEFVQTALEVLQDTQGKANNWYRGVERHACVTDGVTQVDGEGALLRP
jgi:hypothetical protein